MVRGVGLRPRTWPAIRAGYRLYLWAARLSDHALLFRIGGRLANGVRRALMLLSHHGTLPAGLAADAVVEIGIHHRVHLSGIKPTFGGGFLAEHRAPVLGFALRGGVNRSPSKVCSLFCPLLSRRKPHKGHISVRSDLQCRRHHDAFGVTS